MSFTQTYSTLCEVKIDHVYFQGYQRFNSWDMLQIIPLPETVELLKNYRILFKKTRTGFKLAKLPTPDLVGLSKLRFGIRIVDRNFIHYTGGVRWRNWFDYGKPLYVFSNSPGVLPLTREITADTRTDWQQNDLNSISNKLKQCEDAVSNNLGWEEVDLKKSYVSYRDAYPLVGTYIHDNDGKKTQLPHRREGIFDLKIDSITIPAYYGPDLTSMGIWGIIELENIKPEIYELNFFNRYLHWKYIDPKSLIEHTTGSFKPLYFQGSSQITDLPNAKPENLVAETKDKLIAEIYYHNS